MLIGRASEADGEGDLVPAAGVLCRFTLRRRDGLSGHAR